MELIRFDRNVELYTPQPITIRYVDQDGKQRKYTPDGLIEYRKDISPGRDMQPVLCEIKYREDFRADWRNLIRRFRVAKAYAQDMGWQFRVYTEREIRTPYLANARFLTGYISRVPDPDTLFAIIDKLADLRESDPEALMLSLFRDRWTRAAALPVLWYLVAERRIGCDLSEPLNMRSKIWTLEGC